ASTVQAETSSEMNASRDSAMGAGAQDSSNDAAEAEAEDPITGSGAASGPASPESTSDGSGHDASTSSDDVTTDHVSGDDVVGDDAGEQSSDAPAGDVSAGDSDSDASPADAALDDAALDDAGSPEERPDDSGIDSEGSEMAGECRPERTNTVPGGTPIDVGVFCDVVFLCATSEQASSAKLLAADFQCVAATGEYGCGQQVCELFPSAQGRRLVQGEVDQICGLSNLDVGAGAIQCRVYL